MELLTRIAGVGLDVLDAWPRRRLPVLVVPALLAVAALWPEWLLEVIAARYQPLVDNVMDVVSSRTAGP